MMSAHEHGADCKVQCTHVMDIHKLCVVFRLLKGFYFMDMAMVCNQAWVWHWGQGKQIGIQVWFIKGWSLILSVVF